MKKLVYTVGCILIGFVLATSTSAFADTVKSLIGKKVTGEYTIIVNGEKLADKGAIIDGKANVPVRAISESLGADIKVSGKTITVTSDQNEGTPVSSEPTSTNPSKPATGGNKYLGDSKASLEELKYSIENKKLKPVIEGRKAILAEIEILKTSGMNGEPAPGLVSKEKQLAEYDAMIADATEELRLVNEALAAIK
ncbi:stalk domain-containing protein [Paenibacillus sp. FSL W8-0187]|uniref:stalk domain-containing protein n=1 Tax=Paenibacillus sp. FSL W8-0187 TaxID=2921710 RepID=UPI0030D9988D